MLKELQDQFLNLNVNDKTETKTTGGKNLTYLSWAWAVQETLKIAPDFTYEVKMFDGKPYIYDPLVGYMVFTQITIAGITREMWLPVMDGANKAMKDKPYTYMTKFSGEKSVDAADMFDINKTIMRCLTKNLAMFGLGVYIYAGEDLPEGEVVAQKQADINATMVKADEMFANLVKDQPNKQELLDEYAMKTLDEKRKMFSSQRRKLAPMSIKTPEPVVVEDISTIDEIMY